MIRQSVLVAIVGAVYLGLGAFPVNAETKHGPGVSDSGIKIGQTMPYTGPLSAASVIGKSESAYFRMLNEWGGINGRRVTLISLDDQYSPPKTLEQTRRLVEQDEYWRSSDRSGPRQTQRQPPASEILTLLLSPR